MRGTAIATGRPSGAPVLIICSKIRTHYIPPSRGAGQLSKEAVALGVPTVEGDGVDGDLGHLLDPGQHLLWRLVRPAISQQVYSLGSLHCSRRAEGVQCVGAAASSQGLHPLPHCCEVLV